MDFDEKLEMTGKLIDQALANGAKIHLEALLDEIRITDCNTVEQVVGLIHSRIEMIDERLEQWNEQ